jgi:hypothetical protein
MTQTISSTHYRFSYQIRSDNDIPDDFLIPNQDLYCESAVFLPQDQASGPQRESSHPPRIFFLMPDCLKVYTHPTANQAVTVIDLDHPQIVEVGRFLLLS